MQIYFSVLLGFHRKNIVPYVEYINFFGFDPLDWIDFTPKFFIFFLDALPLITSHIEIRSYKFFLENPFNHYKQLKNKLKCLFKI